MTLLFRYLVRQNLFLILVILLISTGLYVLTDIFERLDNFLESGVTVGTMLLYFFVKIPSIISVMLPAVFMIAIVVQMNMLERSRELIALNAGGVSPSAVVRFIIVYGIFWALAQFAFAQVMGVTGERISGQIWQEDVRGRILEETKIQGLWFTERNNIVHIGAAWPLQNRGEELQVYMLDDTGVGISQIVKAKSFIVADGEWQLADGQVMTPAEYSSVAFERMALAIRQDLSAFQISSGSGVKPQQLSLFELSQAIERLENSGSNVESLRTAWHAKIAYACSIIIMGILALYVSRLTGNIYKAVVLSMLIVFFYYGVNTLSVSMGEKGVLTPLVGAWFADCFFLCIGLVLIFRPAIAACFRRA